MLPCVFLSSPSLLEQSLAKKKNTQMPFCYLVVKQIGFFCFSSHSICMCKNHFKQCMFLVKEVLHQSGLVFFPDAVNLI